MFKFSMKKFYLFFIFFIFSFVEANNLDLAKSLRNEANIIDAGWDNPNSMWVVFLQEEVTVNYTAKGREICKLAKEEFNINNRFEITFASKVTKQTFKTHNC